MKFLLNLLIILVISASTISGVFAAEFMSVSKAHQQSTTGDLLLVDIRRPSEWKQTGVAKNAAKISMHQKRFLDRIARHTKGNKTTPVALICAHGIRSTHMIRILEKNGYTNVYNVKEGMLGSKEGPGWIAKGLPLQ